MDSTTAIAIVTALTAGAKWVASGVGSELIHDAYTQLKARFLHSYSDLDEAVDSLEYCTGWKIVRFISPLP